MCENCDCQQKEEEKRTKCESCGFEGEPFTICPSCGT